MNINELLDFLNVPFLKTFFEVSARVSFVEDAGDVEVEKDSPPKPTRKRITDYLHDPLAGKAVEYSRSGRSKRSISAATTQTPPRTSRKPTGTVSLEALERLGDRRTRSLTQIRLRTNIGDGNTFARLPSTNMELALDLAERRLGQTRGLSRQAQIRGNTNQFLVWLQDLPPETDGVDTAWKMVWYVELKIAEGIFTLGTGEKFLRTVRQSLCEMGYVVDEEVLQEFRKGYDRSGCRKPEHQAPPATRLDVQNAAKVCTPLEALGLWLAWKTASRIGEIQHLKRDHVKEESPGVWSISFPYHKGDPFRLGSVGLVNLTKDEDAEIHALLQKRVVEMNCTAPLTTITTQNAASYMGLVRKGLTAHSIKRGSLVAMLESGVPITTIQAMAKHRDLDTLLKYLPKVGVALAMGMSEASKQV
eukprot:PhM_4_TR18660/c3_g2_i2/m.19852